MLCTVNILRNYHIFNQVRKTVSPFKVISLTEIGAHKYLRFIHLAVGPAAVENGTMADLIDAVVFSSSDVSSGQISFT